MLRSPQGLPSVRHFHFKVQGHQHPPRRLSPTHSVCLGCASNSLCLIWGPPCPAASKDSSPMSACSPDCFFPEEPLKGRKEAGPAETIVSEVSPPPSHAQTGQGFRSAGMRQGEEACAAPPQPPAHDCMTCCCFLLPHLAAHYVSSHTSPSRTHSGWDRSGRGREEKPGRPRHTFPSLGFNTCS